MDCVVVMIIALKTGARTDSLERYFRESVEKMRTEERVPESVTFTLYKPVKARRERVWITRFPEAELNRVNRAAWPFVLLLMHGMLTEIRGRFAADVTVASSPALTAEGLVDRWNEQHGRFIKLSLD
jgi:hypothetical protein